MTKRSDWLSEVARPVAEEMRAQTGSLKQVFSAGVLAFADLTPELREYYLARASGRKLTVTRPGKSPLYKEFEKMLLDYGVIEAKGHARPPKEKLKRN